MVLIHQVVSKRIKNFVYFVDEIINNTRESSDKESEKQTSPGNIEKVLDRLNCDVPQTGKVDEDPDYITVDEDLSYYFSHYGKIKLLIYGNW